jgi:group I intron endonuclease
MTQIVAKKRKARSDRNHAIYTILNNVTGEQYIGITAISSTVRRALAVRVRKHIQRARAENKTWGLCESIRTHGNSAFTYGLLEVVRGKKAAHARETALIKEFNPALNTFK